MAVRKSDRIVVIGAGLAGLSCAYFLGESGHEIVVVDAAGVLGGSSTRQSAAMITTLTGHPETSALAIRSRALYPGLIAKASDALGSTVPQFHECGFALVGIEASARSSVEAEFQQQRELGNDVELCTGRDINSLTGVFRLPDDSLVCLAPGDGWVEIASLIEGLICHLEERGVGFQTGTVVSGLRTDDESVSGVEFVDGSFLDAQLVVNAAGLWAGEVSASVGDRFAVDASRKTLVSIVDDGLHFNGPIVEIVDDGWYFRPAEKGMLLGVGHGRMDPTPALGSPPPMPDKGALQSAWNKLARWTNLDIEKLRESADIRTWAGHRPLNSRVAYDPVGREARLPLVGGVEEVRGYFRSCAWGEFGVTLAPVGGLLVAGAASVNSGS